MSWSRSLSRQANRSAAHLVFYARAGLTAKAYGTAATLTSPFLRARTYAALRDPARMWPMLEQALADEGPALATMLASPEFEAYRHDRRFLDFAARAGFPLPIRDARFAAAGRQQRTAIKPRQHDFRLCHSTRTVMPFASRVYVTGDANVAPVRVAIAPKNIDTPLADAAHYTTAGMFRAETAARWRQLHTLFGRASGHGQPMPDGDQSAVRCSAVSC